MNDNFNKQTNVITMSGQTASFTLNVPFLPSYAGINLESKISDATVSQYKIIKTTGANNFVEAKFNLNVTGISDSTFIRVEHNFAAPDISFANAGFAISPNRYYKIDGIFSAGFKGTAIISYDGRSATTAGNQYLDNLLFNIQPKEDSLVLLYRKSVVDYWEVYPYYTKLMSNVNDKYGTVKLDSILKGEYAFGMKTGPSIIQQSNLVSPIKLIPNPAKDKVQIDLSSFAKSGNIIECSIYNTEGKWIKNFKIAQQSNFYEVDLNGFSQGIYYFTFNDGVNFTSKKLMIKN